VDASFLDSPAQGFPCGGFGFVDISRRDFFFGSIL